MGQEVPRRRLLQRGILGAGESSGVLPAAQDEDEDEEHQQLPSMRTNYRDSPSKTRELIKSAIHNMRIFPGSFIVIFIVVGYLAAAGSVVSFTNIQDLPPAQTRTNDTEAAQALTPASLEAKIPLLSKLSYITRLTTIRHGTKAAKTLTPSFFDIISSKPKCLPRGTITVNCGCFCDHLCHTNVKEKAVSKVVQYQSPSHKERKGGDEKFIPRIVHQTWFEPMTREKYPNFSRFAESWKRSKWEYRFYTDEDAKEFLSTNQFPPEVLEAYNMLIPSAFKADLFRYCVLFIHGGVYSDIDILLESDLDVAIDDDVGFMVPVDALPGKAKGQLMCLWNGFIAAAPGHPFLAAVIETIVNNIRNRFTSVDIMHSLCPGQIDFTVAINHADLFTTGPCILGATVNKVLGRHPQTSFSTNTATDNMMFNNNTKVPGRIKFLDANKADMGAHRFTLLEKNLILAATDLPGSDDRKARKHYSNLMSGGGIMYGRTGLYKDNVDVANEVIKIVVA